MNPLKNLIGKQFNELTKNELLQVYENYCDENKYFDTLSICEYLKQNQRYSFEYTKQDVLNLINNEVGFINRIENNFNFWCY